MTESKLAVFPGEARPKLGALTLNSAAQKLLEEMLSVYDTCGGWEKLAEVMERQPAKYFQLMIALLPKNLSVTNVDTPDDIGVSGLRALFERYRALPPQEGNAVHTETGVSDGSVRPTEAGVEAGGRLTPVDLCEVSGGSGES